MQPRSGKTLTTRRVMAAGDLARIPLAPLPIRCSWTMRYLCCTGSPARGLGQRPLRARTPRRARRAAGRSPDLEQPAFRDLTVTRMLGQIDALVQGDPVVLRVELAATPPRSVVAAPKVRARALVLLAPLRSGGTLEAAHRVRRPAAVARERRGADGSPCLGPEGTVSIGFLDDAGRHEAFRSPTRPPWSCRQGVTK